MSPGGDPELSYDGQRLLYAAQLYHAGRTPRIIATGGRSPGNNHMTVAAQSTCLLTSIGVPAKIITELGGINSCTEMKVLAVFFAENPLLADEHEGLITNAAHIPRAIRLAREEGLTFSPLPCSDHSSFIAVHVEPPFYRMRLIVDLQCACDGGPPYGGDFFKLRSPVSRVLSDHNTYIGYRRMVMSPANIWLNFNHYNNMWVSADRTSISDLCTGCPPGWKYQLATNAFDHGNDKKFIRWDNVNYYSAEDWAAGTGLYSGNFSTRVV